MDQVTNSMTLDILQTVATQNQPPKTGGRDKGGSDFQKLMDKAASDKDAKTEEAPKDAKAEATAADKTGKASAKKDGAVQEDPVETAKKLQVFLTPVDPSVLEQYPAEWLPQNLEEGEPVVCVGVKTGVNGEQIPVLIGAREAAQRFGRNDIVYGYDVSDPKADAMLELTDPTVDHSPAALLEKVVAEQFGKEADSTAEAVRPEARETVAVERDEPLMEMEMEVTGAQQAPQPLFHDVKAVPVKVGEVYDAPRTEEPSVARQVDAGVALALEKGESTVRIQLTPANLGSVTVEISRSAEGIIRVALNAHSGETRNLLERHAGELQGLLSSRTQQSVEVSVQRQQESQQNQNHNYDGHNGHAQDGEHRQRRQQEQSGSQDFIQQLRLGLVSADGDE